VTITEAVKDMYAAMPVETVPRRRLVLADAASRTEGRKLELPLPSREGVGGRGVKPNDL
jgi:hypothetical protein